MHIFLDLLYSSILRFACKDAPCTWWKNKYMRNIFYLFIFGIVIMTLDMNFIMTLRTSILPRSSHKTQSYRINFDIKIIVLVSSPILYILEIFYIGRMEE